MIELVDVEKCYGATRAIHRTSLSVAAGELLVLVGGSGSGKTTILKMINRLVEPSSGLIRVGGEDVSVTPPHLLRRSIGYVFQKVGLFPHLTVGENVAITPSLLGWSAARTRARVDESLAWVELDPSLFRDRRPYQLSGGQAQRVGVARALAAEPKIMLLDEPFGALDPLTRDKLQDTFRTIRARLELTAILVTHDMSEALGLGDRIGVMREGRLVQIGTGRELLRNPADEEVERMLKVPLENARQVERLLGPGAPSSGAWP